MISVNQLTVSFGGSDLFKQVSFQLNDRERVGLVGRNGAGKTTLLRLIAGQQQPTSGSIHMPKDIRLGYLPQQMPLAEGRSVIDEAMRAFDETEQLRAEADRLGALLAERTDYESAEYLALIDRLSHLNDLYAMLDGESAIAQAEQALTGLGFRRADFSRPTTEFSGGWRMRIELAKILLRQPQVLLLDEPTNHLDIESIQWLEEYLRTQASAALLLISHDRTFLDNVTQRTVEISLGQLHDYRVPYSKYVELRKERREQQLAAYRNQQKMIEDTQEFIERFRYKPAKAVQVQSRIKMLDRLEVIEVEEEDVATMNIKFPPAPRSGDVVLQAKQVSKSFGDKQIFANANIIIERGQKVAFVGRNGEGKTTMSRIITGELEPTEGIIRLGHNVTLGYFAQNQDEILQGELTVLDTIDQVAVGDIRTRMRDILGAFLFRGDDIDKRVKVLSGGERNRLALAKLMLEPHNLLVLDEPTNHLDMRSKDVLKHALSKFDGTLILVSHDREFLDGLVDKIYEFADGTVREHIGGIFDFLQRRKLDSLKQLESKQQTAISKNKPEAKAQSNDNKTSTNATAPTSQQQREQRRQADRQLRQLQNSIASVEQQISELDEQLAQMEEALANPTAHGIDLSDGSHFEQYQATKQQSTELINRWEALQHELELLQLGSPKG